VGGAVFDIGLWLVGFAASKLSRFFKITSSFRAKSSNPSEMSFPIRTDIPLSSCRGGKFTPVAFEDCSERRHAKATRAHSAEDLLPEAAIDGEDDDLLSPAEILGDGEILFGDRGCNGDCGAEDERRRALREDALSNSFAIDSFFCKASGAFMDSLRAFSVELTISVANMDRSFGDNCSFCWISSSSAGFTRVLAVVLVPLGFVTGAVFELFVEINLSGLDPPGFGNRRSLSSATVAGEQVAVELTASRTESALAVDVDILEKREGAL
jgi:hypothetical protein